MEREGDSDSLLPGRAVVSAGGAVPVVQNGWLCVPLSERTRNVDSKGVPLLRQTPKGRVEPGERMRETALREVREETGYRCRVL